MTRLIFVRHGEAEGNIERKFHGHFNSKLTPNGRKQVEAVAKRLQNEPIDILFSSDLDRTMATARVIANLKGIEVHVMPELREINGGDWEDVPWEDLPQRFPEAYYHWAYQPHLLKMPHGESMVDFKNRIMNAVKKITQECKSENICIVTHGTAIKALLCEFYGKHLSEFPTLKWHDNASITIVHFKEDNFEVYVEGDNAHLGELSTLAKQDWWKTEGKGGQNNEDR